MFLDSGEETETVEVMHAIWKGEQAANRAPRIAGLWLDGKTAETSVRLKAGQVYTARTEVSDPDQDKIRFVWEVLHESTDLKTGGDFETRPAAIKNAIKGEPSIEAAIVAPQKPGAYRLFVYAYDGKGSAAHANIPFFVDPAGEQQHASR
jgi:hypothetical protein